MGPWSFPIVAEARMAERLLEAERARLARTAAAGQGSQGRRDEPQPQASPSSRRRLLAGPRSSPSSPAWCSAGRSSAGQDRRSAASPSSSRSTCSPGPRRSPAPSSLVLGEVPSLPSSPCGVPTFGWVHGPAAWLVDATLLRAPVLLPVCPLP